MRGKLIDLGSYPGLVDSAEDWVEGEIYELMDFENQIQPVDAYEGCDPASDEPHEYRREIRSAILENGEQYEVWAYLYLGLEN